MLAVSAAGHMYSWGAGADGQLAHQVFLSLCVLKYNCCRQTAANSRPLRCRKSLKALVSERRNHCQDFGDKKTPKKNSALREMEFEVSPIVACGWSHAFAIGAAEGESISWGSNQACQLGLGSTGGRNAWVPQLLNERNPVAYKAAGPTGFDLGYSVVQVACGKLHTLALCADGSVWSWGHGSAAGHGKGGSSSGALGADADDSSDDDSMPVSFPWPHVLAESACFAALLGE